jgi:hypothetical protein
LGLGTLFHLEGDGLRVEGFRERILVTLKDFRVLEDDGFDLGYFLRRKPGVDLNSFQIEWRRVDGGVGMVD